MMHWRRGGRLISRRLRPVCPRHCGNASSSKAPGGAFVRAAWSVLDDGPAPESESPDPGGTTLTRFGRFEIRRELGRGAYGVVFLAYDPRLRRQVALKLPRPEVVITREMRAAVRTRRACRRVARSPQFGAGLRGRRRRVNQLHRLVLLSKRDARGLAQGS